VENFGQPVGVDKSGKFTLKEQKQLEKRAKKIFRKKK